MNWASKIRKVDGVRTLLKRWHGVDSVRRALQYEYVNLGEAIKLLDDDIDIFPNTEQLSKEDARIIEIKTFDSAIVKIVTINQAVLRKTTHPSSGTRHLE